MAGKNFSVTVITDRTPEEVFNAVRNVRKWWSGLYSETITGGTENLNDEFTFRAGKGLHYSKQKLIEVIPNKKVVWLITESELTFLKKKDEWNGTRVIFEISKKGDKTQLTFTHEGLIPEIECYDSCSSAWTQYIEEKLEPLVG